MHPPGPESPVRETNYKKVRKMKETYFTYIPTKTKSREKAPLYSFEELYNNLIPEEQEEFQEQENGLPAQFYTVRTTLDRIKQTQFIKQQLDKLRTLISICSIEWEQWKKEHPKEKLDDQYYHFEIPKHNGGLRPIDAPKDWLMTWLKDIQRELQDRISILPNEAAHAYVKTRSNLTAVQRHQKNNSRWKVHIDFKNFFGSINHEWACEMLKKVYPFTALNEEEWSNFKEILKTGFLKDGETLPQGTPLSPYLTNLIMIPIDYTIAKNLQILGKAKGTIFVYTRFADDIIISSREAFDYKAFVQIIKEALEMFEAPIRINEAKTKYGSTSGRNWELGLMWNQHGNITLGSKRIRLIKQSLYNYCTHKTEVIKFKLDAQQLLGEIAYFKHIEPEYAQHILDSYSKKYNRGISITAELKQFIRELR